MFSHGVLQLTLRISYDQQVMYSLLLSRCIQKKKWTWFVSGSCQCRYLRRPDQFSAFFCNKCCSWVYSCTETEWKPCVRSCSIVYMLLDIQEHFNTRTNRRQESIGDSCDSVFCWCTELLCVHTHILSNPSNDCPIVVIELCALAR